MSQLLLVTAVMGEDSERGLKARGLTQARAQVIWELGPRQPMTQSALAALLKVTPRNVTTLIDGLEETGFVTRSAHPDDRRAIALTLTRKGQRALASLKADYQTLAELLFGGVGEAELKTFGRVAKQAAERLLAAQAPKASGRAAPGTRRNSR